MTRDFVERLAAQNAHEAAARLAGYTEAEEMIAEGLRKLAEVEDVKAIQAGRESRFWHDEANARRVQRESRAACLREAALAVSVGQFRDVPKGE